MTRRLTIGTLLALPFLAVSAIMYISGGWWAVLWLWASIAATVACMYAGAFCLVVGVLLLPALFPDKEA